MIVEINDKELPAVINSLARGAGELNQRLIEMNKQGGKVVKGNPERKEEIKKQLEDDFKLTYFSVLALESVLVKLGLTETETGEVIEKNRKDILVRSGYFARQATKPGEN